MKVFNQALFLLRQRFHRFEIPATPQLQETSLVFFENELKRCQFYLEYGSGGSTVLAARLEKEFISVESDLFYMKAVIKKVGPAEKAHFIHADIGVTGYWGAPYFKKPTPRRVSRWKKYPQAPWDEIAKRENKPDLVLIDGRFRVACALTCLRHLADSSKAKILVDDYVNRPHYREIEQFASLESMQGRMAVFSPKFFDPQKINNRISFFQSDWR